jgi:hypothetical protein
MKKGGQVNLELNDTTSFPWDHHQPSYFSVQQVLYVHSTFHFDTQNIKKMSD